MTNMQLVALIVSCLVAGGLLFGVLFALAAFVGKFFNGLVEDD